jgi:dTDP-4-amino-4,6-dideoxygalactose transaminase
VANGTDAIALALIALGVTPGDEVIAPSHTAVPTVAAITQIGATPVLIDIDPRTCNLCPRAVEAALTERARAIVAVHLYGLPADVDALARIAHRRGIPLLEDCAQAHGARQDSRHVGVFGAAGAFSFYPTKNLAALGDGGMVVTQSKKVAERIRRLRQYGWDKDRVSQEPGWNSRLDELQAAILRVRLGQLSVRTRRRQAVAARLLSEETIARSAAQIPPSGAEHAYHLFVVRTPRRELVRRALAQAGVPTAIHYPRAVHQHPAYAAFRRDHLPLDETEKAAEEVLSIPGHAGMSDEQVEYVAVTVARCLEQA